MRIFINFAGSSGPTNVDAVLPDSPNEDFHMDHPGPSALSDDDEDIYMDHPGPSTLANDCLEQSKSFGQISQVNKNIYVDHEEPTGLTHEDVIDHPPSPLLNDDAGIGVNLDNNVYGLSNLRRSRRIAGHVENVSQQRWGSNVPVRFVNDRDPEESVEEEDIEDDESISDVDVASDEGLDGYEDDDDELFAGSGQEGISLWDSLGEGFLREASQLGMSTSFWYYYY